MAKKVPQKRNEVPEIDPRIIAIGEKIRALRIEKGYVSAEFFAWENKIPRVTYARLENGTNFTMNTLLKVLDAHGMTMADFFSKIQ